MLEFIQFVFKTNIDLLQLRSLANHVKSGEGWKIKPGTVMVKCRNAVMKLEEEYMARLKRFYSCNSKVFHTNLKTIKQTKKDFPPQIKLSESVAAKRINITVPHAKVNLKLGVKHAGSLA